MSARSKPAVHAAVLAVLSLLPMGEALGAPPTEEEIKQIQSAVRDFQRKTPRAELTIEKYRSFVAEQLKDVDVAELTPGQMDQLFQLLMMVPEKKEAVSARLDELAKAEDAEGARAAVMYTQTMFGGGEPEARIAAFRRALTHPGLGDAIQGENGDAIFQQVAYAGEDVTKPLAKEVLGLQKYLTTDLPPENISGTMDYLSTLNGMGEAVDAATKENVRTKLVAMFNSAASKARESGDESKKGLADYLERSVKYLDGAAARGKLIDHQVPAVDFTWSSSDTPLKSLGDFKGKVVVVDFWATWCGPCVASFPAVRELQKHYDGYDVTIVGVTSLQGKHYPGDGAEPVDTEGNPEKEYELMKEFMAKKQVTWPIAFSTQDVFNPDFGVRGIPHVAIIDPEGIVRYNGLHPMAPMHEKTAKIDGLLKKAGLATPAPVEAPKADEDADKKESDG